MSDKQDTANKPKFQFNLPDGAGFADILGRLCKTGADVTIRIGGEQLAGRITAIDHDYLMLLPAIAITQDAGKKVMVYDSDDGKTLPMVEMIPLGNITSVSWYLTGPKPVYFTVPPG